MRRRTWLSTVLIVLAVAAGCGDDGSAEADPPDEAGTEADGGTEGDAGAGGAEVAIQDADGRRFSPADVTVSAGGTVAWTHEGEQPHTVTATDGTFDSGNLAGGDTFEFTFESAGTVQYVCSIHSDMTGTVTVS